MGGGPGSCAGAPPARGAALSFLLLDISVLIDAERSKEEIARTVGDDDDVAIAAITAAELLAGVHLAAGRQKTARQRFAEQAMASIPVIPYDLRVAAAHAGLLAAVRRAGRPRGAHDLIIAATAVASQRIVVTADPAAFADLPGVSCRSYR
jgi:tRNA(fMet)-specific endonuclease VapC